MIRTTFSTSRLRGPAALAVLVALLGCPGEEARRRDRDSVVVGISSAPSTLNDVLSSGESGEREIFELLYLSLVDSTADLSEGPQSFAPELATSWSFSEDGRELTFELRRDARWSDGAPVTAHDVRFTWQAQTSPDVAWAFSALKRHIVDVVVVDDWTVRFVFDEVSASQLADANEGVILPRHVWGLRPFEEWRKDPAWFVDRMVSSGPYRISSWRPGSNVTLTANPHHFEPSLPRIARAELQVVTEDGMALRMLEAGELDFVAQVRPRNVGQIERNQALRLIRYPRRQQNFIAWNLDRPLFSSVRVRRALTHAVDRRALIDTVLSGQALLATSVIPHGIWAHDESIEPLPFDPALARRLLREEGWVDTDGDDWIDRDGAPFRFEVMTNTRAEVRWEALQLIRENLRQVGIDARLTRVEATAAVVAIQSREFDAALMAISPDTTLDFSFTLHSDAVATGYNFSGYRNPEVDRLIETLNASDDTATILELALEIQRLVHRDQPMLMLWEPWGLAAASVDLDHVAPDAVSTLASMPWWSWRSAGSR